MRTLFLALLLTACAGSSRHGSLDVVSTLAADQAPAYEKLGDVVSSEPHPFDGDEDHALRELERAARRDGADLLVIEEKKRVPCVLGEAQTCFVVRGRAYKRKDEISSKAAAPTARGAEPLPGAPAPSSSAAPRK